MKKITILTLILGVSTCLSACNSGATTTSSGQINNATMSTIATTAQDYKGKLVLIGGAITDNNTQIYNAIATETGKKTMPGNCSQDWSKTTCPKIAIVTSGAATSADGDDAYNNDVSSSALSYEHLYQKYGFAVKHVSVNVDNYKVDTNPTSENGQLNKQILEDADVVYFNGGDQARHARSWLNSDGSYNQLLNVIAQRYREDKLIVIGSSAGTAIQSNPTYGEGSSYGHLYFAKSNGLASKLVSDGEIDGTGLKDTRADSSSLQYLDNGGKMPGFGFAPSNMLVDTHFDARGRLARLIPALYATAKNIGVGVDENTAFFIVDGEASVYGEHGVFIADNSQATRADDSNSFGVKNIKVNYLTSGDKYNLVSKVVTSNKSKITSPYYSGYKDSSDITKAYETTSLITRLVDQTGSDNIGKTATPSDYPKSTTAFRLTFAKDSKTQGYYSSSTKQYTVANAIVDINK